MNIIPFSPNSFSEKDYRLIVKDKNRIINIDKLGLGTKYQFVDSGSSGIYNLLKSFDLPINSNIGIPALICNSVSKSIKKAGHIPYYLDINYDYQLSFNEVAFKKANIKVLILPHLYGALHPFTREIDLWCKANNVLLISDSAQSFGLRIEHDPVIEIGNGGIYSFGVGKSSTCAGGAVVYGLNKRIIYSNNHLITLLHFLKSRLILKSRILINGKMKWGKTSFIFTYLIMKIAKKSYDVNYLQFNSLNHFLWIKEVVFKEREVRWNILYNNLKRDKFIVPKPYIDCSKYKFVFSLDMENSEINKFLRYLRKKGIIARHCPHTNCAELKKYELPIYFTFVNKIIELSTECTIPIENFYEAAKIMNLYFE